MSITVDNKGPYFQMGNNVFSHLKYYDFWCHIYHLSILWYDGGTITILERKIEQGIQKSLMNCSNMNPRMVFNWTEKNAEDVFYSVSRTSKNANLIHE